MITEIATFQLKADIDLSGPETPAGNHFREVTVPNMKAHGARSVYYGRFLEKPYTFMFFVNWNSIDNHKAYLKSPYVELCFMASHSVGALEKAIIWRVPLKLHG